MKKIMLVLAFIIIAVYSFSQTTQTDLRTKEYYLAKSRHQKTIAWIMLGGGAVLTAAGFAAEHAQVVNGSSGDLPSILAVPGALSVLGSVPLFIIAAHNKHKAVAITLNMQNIPMPAAANLTVLLHPALGLKIAL